MIKKLIFTLLVSFIGLSSANAALGVSTTTENHIVLTKTTPTPMDMLKSVQGHLLEKKATEGLSRKQKRQLRKVNKKIKKAERAAEPGSGDRDWMTTVLISFFVGGFGIDRFYLGYTTLGILKLLTLGGFGIWYLIDFIMILMKKLKPKNGVYTD